MVSMKRVGVLGALIALLAVTTTFVIGAAAQAQTSPNTANTLRVSPIRSDVTVEPGQTHTVQVTVSNPTDNTILVQPVINDFVAGDERGTPALILEDGQYASSHSLKRFVQPLEAVEIAAGGARTVEVIVSIPQDAAAGGYFGAVRFTPTDPDDGGQVNLSANVASLILLTVPGEVSQTMNITDFELRQNGVSRSIIGDGSNLQAFVRFKNEGGIQLGPTGKVFVRKGDAIVYEGDFNNQTPRDMVLPGAARSWDIPVEGVEGFGRYTISATFTYGSGNQTIEVTRSFWVIPPLVAIGALIAVLLVIAAIVFTVLAIVKKQRRAKSGARSRSRYGRR